MSLTADDILAIRDAVKDVVEEIAIPKPSRAAELYAALTLSILLLREQVAGNNVPFDRMVAAEKEIHSLLKKRDDLEEALNPQIGGS